MIHSVRGFRDLLPPESGQFTELEAKAREVFALYNYAELRIPTVEMHELFVKSTGETTDIVEKEMYVFEDAGGRRLALRPEGTPGVVRAYLEHQLHAAEARQKFYYMGAMFRAERPQAGRYREFEQIGAEYLGNPHPCADAEVIIMLARLLREAGLPSLTIELNSLGCQNCRPKHREALQQFLNSSRDTLCDNCKKRIERNPLRALDCKVDGPRLAGETPRQELCPDCLNHFETLKSLLDAAKEKYVLNPNLVRGLDYYTRTVFEFKSDLIGSQDTLAAGGRYDTLVKSMDGPDIPAVGWGLGVDRVIMAAKSAAIEKKPAAFVICADGGAQACAFGVMEQLRLKNIIADGGLFSQSLKAQMRSANKSGAKFAVIIGSEEVKNLSVALKNLETGEQRQIPRQEIISALTL